MKPPPGSLSPLLHVVGFLAVLGGFVRAQTDPAVVHNYDVGAAGLAGPVWAIARAPDGTLFVGSNRLSIFNGHGWENLPIPKAYAFRALAAQPSRQSVAGSPAGPDARQDQNSSEAGRVWVGAIGAVGYVEKQPTGKWAFVSLAPPLQAAGIANAGDVWQVHAIGEGAVFITTDRVLRWTGQAFETWHMPAEPHLLSFSDGADVLVYQRGRGLWRLPPQAQPVLEVADALLPARPITWFSPLPRSDNRGTISALAGLGAEAFRMTGRLDASGALPEPRFERLEHVTSALQEIVPTYSEWIDSDVLAIGTYRAGVVLIDKQGQLRGRIDRTTGLDDDNVTALRSGQDGRLWVGHGSGFARVDGVARAAFFHHRATFGSGLPRSLLTHEGDTYVLTSRGFFRIDASQRTHAGPAGEGASGTRFVPLLDAQGMLHDAAVIGGQVWIGGFGGIWRVTSAGAEQEYFSATDVVQVASSSTRSGEVLFLEGYELKALRSTERGWASYSLEARVHDTPVSLVEFGADTSGVPSGVWVSTVAGGIYRFAWTDHRGAEHPVLRQAAHYEEGRGLPRDTTTPRLTHFGGQLYALAEDGVLALRADAGGFDLLPELAGFPAVAATTTSSPQRHGGDSGALWVAQARTVSGPGPAAVLSVRPPRRPGDALTSQPLDTPGLDQVGQITGAELVPATGEPALWIAGTDGVLKLDTSRLRAATGPLAVRFVGVKTDATDRPITPIAGGRAGGEWKPGVKRVSFAYTTPAATTGEPVFFQTRLGGVENEWSAAAHAMSREFTGLRPGAYTFEVRTLDRFGRAGPPAAYPFTIAPPWFVRWPALTGYAAAALGAAGLLMRWRMVRLRRQNQKLNRLVAERTRELELSNTVRAEFLENVSHEIRNPLNGLNGLLGLLKQASLAPRERELMDSLQSCARNLNRTYEEVLGFSKLEYGYISREERRFSLRELLREIVAGFAWQAAQQECRITIETSHGQEAGELEPRADHDAFIGDANKLCTIVTNFVGNALKYAPHHPIEIKVEQHSLGGELVSVCIEVCDHGPGIPPEEQGLIFQKFVRGSGAKSGKVAGTGLGLATCRVMAKALGGSLGVESEAGAGSVFFVRVPLQRAPAAGAAEPAGATIRPEPPNGSARRTALIVDDEHYNQTVLQGIALTLGYEPAVAADASEAAVQLQARSFDVILLDWELPGLKGGEIARRVRAAPQGDKPVIIATTGHDSDEMRRQCQEAGMDEFVLKPYDVDAIRQCIARVVQVRARGTMTGSVAAPAPSPPADAAALNLRAFEHYAAGAPAKAGEAARDFVAALEHELATLAHAVASDDGAAIAQSAHRVRALGGLIAASDFTEAARRLELLARPGTGDQRRRAWRELFAAGESLKIRLASAPRAAPAATA